MALGATSRDVLMMVLKRAVVLIGAGTAIGFGASLVLASTARALLFQVSPHDPATVATVTGTLLLVGVVASVVPALRATRVDPLVALRTD
jgi:ABC-type antimicrobial peptide transport system permease subunit